MKRQLTASSPTPIRTGAAPKTQERELEAVTVYMVEQISKRFLSGAINALQAGTVEKFADSAMVMRKHWRTEFVDRDYSHLVDKSGNEYDCYDESAPDDCELVTVTRKEEVQLYDVKLTKVDTRYFADAQSGNYAKIFLGLAGKVTNKMLDQFSDDRIEEMVNKILKKVDNRSRDEFYSRIEKTIGISSKELAATEAMKETTNALMLETSQWVKKLRDETLELYTSNTLRAMALGNGLEGITDEFDQLKEKRKNHAKFTARNQVNNYNSISTKIRAQNLGITQAVWVTAHDERVRPSHQAREGKTFNLDEGLYSSLDGKTLLPGTDYQCRCTMTLILPEE